MGFEFTTVSSGGRVSKVEFDCVDIGRSEVSEMLRFIDPPLACLAMSSCLMVWK